MDLPIPIVMGDAAAKNWTAEFDKIVTMCLAHARRNFVEVQLLYPAECKRMLQDLATVYYHDSQTRLMSPEERLDYHQEHSEPIMKDLKLWLEAFFKERKIERNESLGKAICYFLNYFEHLTQFLKAAGAPIDNNAVERSIGRILCSTKPPTALSLAI